MWAELKQHVCACILAMREACCWNHWGKRDSISMGGGSRGSDWHDLCFQHTNKYSVVWLIQQEEWPDVLTGFLEVSFKIFFLLKWKLHYSLSIFFLHVVSLSALTYFYYFLLYSSPLKKSKQPKPMYKRSLNKDGQDYVAAFEFRVLEQIFLFEVLCCNFCPIFAWEKKPKQITNCWPATNRMFDTASMGRTSAVSTLIKIIVCPSKS